MVVRQYNEELQYLEKITPNCWKIKKGFQPNMNVSVMYNTFYSVLQFFVWIKFTIIVIWRLLLVLTNTLILEMRVYEEQVLIGGS